MATTIARLLHHLALFLLLVQFADAVVLPKTKNHVHAPLKPRSSSTYIIHANHLAKPSPFATLDRWYTSMVASHSPRGGANDSTRLLYTYDAVMHGFAVQLTGDEARLMSSAPGVIGVYEDRVLYPQTTRSPGFMGLEPGTGAWKQTDFGDGVIIGIIDSGVWPESPSFRDVGLGPVRSSWKGRCVDAHNFNASLCNNKLVGAKSFVKSDGSPSSPRDTDGHGTHVASTAAGSEVPGRDTGFPMFAQATARGVAPKARVAMYSVLALSDNTADTVAAIDTAVKDGVDIISMSLAYPAAPFYNDPLAIAVFGAEKKGVFVVLAGGNGGPDASTVLNVAPWMTTVGAGTVDRLLPATLRLGDGTELTGQSLYGVKTNGTSMVPLVFSECSERSVAADQITGKIAVCVESDEGHDFGAVQHAGPAGLVLIDPDEYCSSYQSVLPSLVISDATAVKLKAYMKFVQKPVASFSFAVEAAIGVNRAPIVARFSARGPNPIVPELLKPDVIAPGVNILAATTGFHPSPTNARRNNKYEVESGTSMACPHVAGVAALIKKKHPSWTPAMVRSALMTTAGMVDNRGGDILDNGHRVTVDRTDNFRVATPLVAGAGHVQPDLALDPGLVYDAGERDYVDFLCALNYTAEQMRRFVPDFVRCTGTLAGGPAGLNYPSFVVAFDSRTDVRTLTRTLTSVSEEAETYNVTVVAPEHVKVTVAPTTLEFKEHMETRSYSVEFRNEAGGNREAGEWDFGRISWASGKHKVRSPVAFHWMN